MKKIIQSNSATETEIFGEEFSRTLSAGSIVCLYGNLGAGKTTLTKGFAKGLGIKERVISPTFSLMRQYKPQNGNISTLYHLDLYRLESLEEIHSIGITDILADKEGIVLIEWANKLGKLLPEKRIDIALEEMDDTREITITWMTPK
jgi:tRNA threonylcarbamoyladenosine biosynthesis protein TsaE